MEPLHPDDPAQVGPYRLTSRLGAGGMGQVYLGHDGKGRQVAVKVIHPGHGADAAFRGRFEREITTARRANSPWTADLLAADPLAPQPWLATEYVPGPNLEHLVQGTGPLPEPAVALLAARLARALAHLHAVGVIHRDLKPSNVLIASDGPRLIDFGVARAVDEAKLTNTGTVVGTPAFMSPEQAFGYEVGPPSDVFSLAAVLTYAVTGSGPFGSSSGNPVAMLRRVTGDPADLARVPPALRAVLEPCLAKDPAQRPTTGRLIAQLQQADLPPDRPWLPPAVAAIVASHAPAPARRGLGSVRTPVILAAAAAAVVLVVVAAVLIGAGPTTTPGTDVTATLTTPPRAFPENPQAPPPPEQAAGLVPSVIQGWVAAVSTTRNAAYDVPPTWVPASGSLIKGYERPDGTNVLMSGVAQYQTTDWQPCEDEQAYTLAWSGVTGSTTADHAAAARTVAEVWAPYFQDDNGPPVQADYSAPQPVTVNGQAASHIVTEITVTSPACGSARNVVHTVAVPDGKGQSVVLVILAERDVPGALADADVEQIIPTLRPAGLPEKCGTDRQTVGSWC